jgi:hypothetical protein
LVSLTYFDKIQKEITLCAFQTLKTKRSKLRTRDGSLNFGIKVRMDCDKEDLLRMKIDVNETIGDEWKERTVYS